MIKQIFKPLVWIVNFGITLSLLTILYFSPILRTPPTLTGPYVVGYKDIRCTDESRQEPHTSTSKYRSVLVRFYYPTISNSTTTSHPYPDSPTLTKYLSQELTEEFKVPKYIAHRFAQGLTCHAQQNATITKNQHWPVVLFSHGIGTGCVMTSTYLEELASHGYVVAAVFHPYDTGLVKFPDGEIITVDSTFEKHVKELNRSEIYAYRGKAHWLWLKDLNFVTHYLIKENTNSNSFLYQALDTKNIGMFGHSHGGAVAIDFCKTNPSCKVGINLDGWTKTANTTEGFTKPFMFLFSQDGNDVSIKPLYENMKEYAEMIIVPGAGHSAFSDKILLKQPIPWFMGVATKNPLEIRMTINGHIKRFFDKHLKN